MDTLQRIGLMDFYPRSPRGERPKASSRSVTVVQFLSALPAWGATAIKDVKYTIAQEISIRAPREGSDIAHKY